MMSAAQPVALLTSDPSFWLPPTEGSRLRVDRQPWRDSEGPLSARALVAQMMDGDPFVVCFAPDVPLELALEIGAILDHDHNSIGAVMVAEPTDHLLRTAMRTGIRDVVSPAAIGIDLVASLELALDRAERVRAAGAANIPAGPRAKVIVVLSPKGGSGKTMVATNLAVALATASPGTVALVDYDCVFGDVASVLGITTENTIGRLATMGNFDSTTLKVFLTQHERSGLYVLASSGAPEEGEQVDAAIASRVIDLLVQDFTHIVVDTSAGLDERALAAIDKASDVILLASLDVTSIRNLSKEIDALDRLGITEPVRHFVLNRADARVGIEVPEVEAALGMSLAAALPSTRLVPLAMNQGRSVVMDEPTSPVGLQLTALAARFLPAMASATTPASRSGRFRRR